MIALRQSMLSSGFTVGLIEVYQSRAMVGLSTMAFFSGSLSTWLIAAGCTPVPARSTCEVAGLQALVDVVGVDVELHVAAVRQRRAVGVGLGVPLGRCAPA